MLLADSDQRWWIRCWTAHVAQENPDWGLSLMCMWWLSAGLKALDSLAYSAWMVDEIYFSLDPSWSCWVCILCILSDVASAFCLWIHSRGSAFFHSCRSSFCSCVWPFQAVIVAVYIFHTDFESSSFAASSPCSTAVLGISGPSNMKYSQYQQASAAITFWIGFLSCLCKMGFLDHSLHFLVTIAEKRLEQDSHDLLVHHSKYT